MKYLWKRPFGVCFIPVFESHHFENWKGKKSQICNYALVFFPPFGFFGGRVLGSYCRKRHDVTMMWPFEKIFHRTNTVNKLILWIKTMGCCGLTCVVWLKPCDFSKRKSVLIFGKSSMMCLLQKFFEFNLHVNFLYFLWKWVNLFGIFTTCKKLRAFGRNPSLWSSYLMPWTPIV